MKKIMLLSMIICQLAISCSSGSDDSNAIEDEVATLLQKPYSSLTPDQQKVKLENEANSMMAQMENSKSATALEALANFETLMSISSPDIQPNRTSKPTIKTGKSFQKILNISGTYAIYTWNPTQSIWIKTSSSTELKFIFPASEAATTNNATLTASSIASTVKIVVDDQTGDEMYLPSSVTAVLTINGTLAAKYEANAVYLNGNPEPTEAGYKLTLNGYVWENYAKRTTPISAKSSFSYNGNNLIDFNVGSTADIDKLMEGSELTKYLGKANCMISLLDNFVMVADMNMEGMANAEGTLENSITQPNYNSSTYYTDWNANNKKMSDGEALAFNKNVKMALVSKKDGTKLADVIQKSEKGNSWEVQSTWNGSYWAYDPYSTIKVQEYDTVLYLRFSDNTEVAMDVYFSSGFDTLETKFQDFINSFN